jgi:hypothetical protein
MGVDSIELDGYSHLSGKNNPSRGEHRGKRRFSARPGLKSR